MHMFKIGGLHYSDFHMKIISQATCRFLEQTSQSRGRGWSSIRQGKKRQHQQLRQSGRLYDVPKLGPT